MKFAALAIVLCCAFSGYLLSGGHIGVILEALPYEGLTILGMATVAVVIDIRDHRRSELETDRMRDLADASVEGLLVCDGQTIVSANKSFSHLIGAPESTGSS